jgi:dTDP-glucose 4,6-dehydratase
MSFESAPVLITGGAGFIGSHLVRQWLAFETSPVVNLDKLTYAGHRSSLGSAIDDPRHSFVQGDVADLNLLHELFAQHRPRAVIHLAAETHVDRSIDQPAEFFETNVQGTFMLLEAALRYWQTLALGVRDRFRLLHVSTDEVFGAAGENEFFREDSPYAPNSPYAASKAAADHFVRTYHRTYGLPTIITNSSNNYGPHQMPEKFIPLTICHALAGQPIPIYGDGLQQRDWLHVEDHAAALRLVLNQGNVGETYLVGSGQQPTNLALAKQICAMVDDLRPGLAHGPCTQLLTHVVDRPGHDRRYAVDASKVQRELAWQPTIDFTTGLCETVRWYLEHPEWIAEAAAKLPTGRVGIKSAELPA